MLIVLHVGASDPSYLHEILQRETALPVSQAQDRERLRPGHIVVARPDYHLVVEEGHVRLARGPRENRARPAIDALFRSAAYVYGPRVIGMVLSGTLDDGCAGLWWIKQRGGVAIVQDPEEAEFDSMPRNALEQVHVDHVVRVDEAGALLTILTNQKAGPAPGAVPKELEVETSIASEGRALQAGVMQLGALTPYTCPECHGALVHLHGGGVPRFRCHTGHAYSINTLLAEVTEYVEQSLWNSIRAIEESAMLLDELARQARDQGHESTARIFDAKGADTLGRADMVRKAAREHQTLSKDNLVEVERRRR